MKLFNLPKLGFDMAYFKSARNWYHPVVGIAINYLFSILIFCNRVEFPLSYEYWWNYLYPFICSIPVYFIAFYGEQKQDEATGKSVSDMRDVFYRLSKCARRLFIDVLCKLVFSNIPYYHSSFVNNL